MKSVVFGAVPVHCFLFITSILCSSFQRTESENIPEAVGSLMDNDRIASTVRLHDDLRQFPVFRNKVAPVTTLASGDVRVILDVILHVGSVLYVDDAQQTMTCSTFTEVQWQDPAFRWDPEQYSNVTKIEMSPDSIWIPTLMLVNSQDPVNIMSHVANIVVHSNGTVRATIYYKTVTLCTMDHSHFPYHTQRCALTLDSVSDCCLINLTFTFMNQSDSKNLLLKSDWEFVSGEERSVFAGLPSVQLQLRRRTVYFTVCLVLPLVLTSYMNTLVFLLPVQCGEKFSFIVTIFVSTSVFLGFFKDVMPRGLDTVPATMKLAVGVLLGGLLVLLATLMVTWRHHHHHHPDPPPLPSPTSTVPITATTSFSPPNRLFDSHHRPRELVQSSAAGKLHTGGSPEIVMGGSGDQCAGRLSQGPRLLCCDAQRLDRVCFLLALVLNTTFLLVLFFD